MRGTAGDGREGSHAAQQLQDGLILERVALFREAKAHRWSRTVQRRWTSFGVGLAALALVCSPSRAASTASVAGTVRDAQGAAQVGAMVQVLSAGPEAIATVFTDIYGRYRIAGLAPGSYRVRATSATFLPATRWNLRLATGMRATVNLTMNMLADPAVWLPAERRAPGEPGDDWTWTLRSAPARPILRVLGDDPAAQEEEGKSAVRMRAAMTGGDAGFGDGGVHNVIALDRVAAGGNDIVLQADLGMGTGMGVPQSDLALSPSGEVAAGYQHKGALGNSSRLVMTYGSHPEIQTANGGGLEWMRLAGAEKMQLGDLAEVEAGNTVYAIRAGGYALSTQPFLRVTIHPGQTWAVRYRMATSRDTQGQGAQDFAALDSLTGDMPVAVVSNGRLTTESGLHQEIAVTRKAGNGVVRVTVYHDDMSHPAVSGTGAQSVAQTGNASAVVDSATGGFQLLGTAYSASGVSVALAEPVGPGMWGSLQYASGAGLNASGADGQSIATAAAILHPVSASATTAALDSSLDCTHTRVRVSYRSQPRGVVTAVNAYGAASDQAYFSFLVRQAISLGNLLPQGLEATVDVTNLLAQGYHPFLSADGRTLYLAQAPRMVKAGLAFNF
jgi:hypothetical protein